MNLSGKKTYFAALASLVTALCAYLADGMDFKAALSLAFNAVFAATIRHGISTSLSPSPPLSLSPSTGIGAAMESPSGVKLTRLQCSPLAILGAVLVMLACVGCAVGGGHVTLDARDGGGVCYVRDGYAVCHYLRSGRTTARHIATGRFISMEKGADGEYTGQLGSAEGVLRFHPEEGLMVVPGSGSGK